MHELYVYMSRRTGMANIGRKGPTRLAGKLRIWPTCSKARRYINSLQVHGSGQDIVGNSMAPRLGDLGLTARHSAGSRKSSLTTPPPCMINNLSKLQNTLYMRMTRETIATNFRYSCRSQLFGSMGFLLADSLRLEETSCHIMPRTAVAGVYMGIIPS